MSVFTNKSSNNTDDTNSRNNTLATLELSCNGEIQQVILSANSFEGLTYQDLKSKALSVFPCLSLNSTPLQFSWMDDELDTVVVSSEEEMEEALRDMIACDENKKKRKLRFEILFAQPELPTTVADMVAIATAFNAEEVSIFPVSMERLTSSLCQPNENDSDEFKFTLKDRGSKTVSSAGGEGGGHTSVDEFDELPSLISEESSDCDQDFDDNNKQNDWAYNDDFHQQETHGSDSCYCRSRSPQEY